MERKKIAKPRNIFFKEKNDMGILLLHGWTAPADVFLPMAEYFNSLGFTGLRAVSAGPWDGA
ncbi:MAG: hypothetical protein PHF35_01010 [Candidatus Moranbacteria bacterium]|nr:hypothetical protein [Candidatus Moranbacteria bacterium]